MATKRIANRIKSALARLRRNVAGVALIEAGFAFPLLVLAGAGGIELTNLTMAYMRVNGIALKVADNAARVRVSIDESDINQIMIGAREMGKSIDFGANGRVIMSSIEPLMSGAPSTVTNQYLRWQRCYGADPANSTHGNQGDGATGTAQATGYGIPTKPKITASTGNATMLVEVVYQYQPLISGSWFGPITIHVQQAMPVRQRADQVIKNGGALATANTAACTNTHTA